MLQHPPRVAQHPRGKKSIQVKILQPNRRLSAYDCGVLLLPHGCRLAKKHVSEYMRVYTSCLWPVRNRIHMVLAIFEVIVGISSGVEIGGAPQIHIPFQCILVYQWAMSQFEFFPSVERVHWLNYSFLQRQLHYRFIGHWDFVPSLFIKLWSSPILRRPAKAGKDVGYDWFVLVIGWLVWLCWGDLGWLWQAFVSACFVCDVGWFWLMLIGFGGFRVFW